MAYANISKRLATLEASTRGKERESLTIIKVVFDDDGAVLSAHMRLGAGVIVPVKDDRLEAMKRDHRESLNSRALQV